MAFKYFYNPVLRICNCTAWQKDFADVIRIVDFKIGKSSWIIQDNPVWSQEPLEA